MITLIWQELNNQSLNKKRDAELNIEIGKITSIINKEVKRGTDSISKRMSKQNSELKERIDILNSNSQNQKDRIIELYEQNRRMSNQLFKSLRRFSLPFPNELKLKSLYIIIDSEPFRKYIPEIKNNMDKFSYGYTNEFTHYNLSSSEYKTEFTKLFEDRILNLSLNSTS